MVNSVVFHLFSLGDGLSGKYLIDRIVEIGVIQGIVDLIAIVHNVADKGLRPNVNNVIDLAVLQMGPQFSSGSIQVSWRGGSRLHLRAVQASWPTG